jgi:hypothetical protein
MNAYSRPVARRFAPDSDLRPLDWVVLGLESRADFELRHSRCPLPAPPGGFDVVLITDRCTPRSAAPRSPPRRAR